MYLGAKYTKLPSFWNVLKMHNPLGLLSWYPMASPWGYGGQNLMNGAHEARSLALGPLFARNPCDSGWGDKTSARAQICWEKSEARCVL